VNVDLTLGMVDPTVLAVFKGLEKVEEAVLDAEYEEDDGA
jgi:hypothetical protein